MSLFLAYRDVKKTKNKEVVTDSSVTSFRLMECNSEQVNTLRMRNCCHFPVHHTTSRTCLPGPPAASARYRGVAAEVQPHLRLCNTVKTAEAKLLHLLSLDMKKRSLHFARRLLFQPGHIRAFAASPNVIINFSLRSICLCGKSKKVCWSRRSHSFISVLYF